MTQIPTKYPIGIQSFEMPDVYHLGITFSTRTRNITAWQAEDL